MRSDEIQGRLMGLLAESPVVVWDDPAGEFGEVLSELELPGVTCCVEREGERFELKALVNDLREGERLLVYRSVGRGDGPDWVADVTAYAPAFAADAMTTRLAELGARDTPEMREAARSFSPLLKRAGGMRRVRALRERFETPNELALAVMVAALGVDVPASADWAVLAFVEAAHAEGAEAACERLRRAGALGAFRRMLGEYVGFLGDPGREGAVAAHVLTEALGMEAPLLVAPSCGEAAARRADEVLRLWVQVARGGGAPCDALSRAAHDVEEGRGIAGALSSCDTDTLARVLVLPSACLAVCSRAVEALACGGELDEPLRAALERLRAGVWRGRYVALVAAVEAAGALEAFRRAHRMGLSSGTLGGGADVVWGAYTSDWYVADTSYRHFRAALPAALDEAPELDEGLCHLADRVEGLYARSLLRDMARAWEDAAAADLASRGHAEGIPRQGDFFVAEVEPLIAKGRRAWVVISDALRYEVAAELGEELERTTQGQVTLASMQAGFPSVTSCGMAALLPHGTLGVVARAAGPDGTPPGIDVLVDGMPTQGTAARGAVLQAHLDAYHPESRGVALQASSFTKMSRAERREAVGDAAVAYLYHNRIDAIGDDATTEDDVFAACADAVGELSRLVALIVREFRATDVLIVSDHGFLYTAQPLAETDKASLSDVRGSVVAYGRRYVVGGADLASEALMPVSLAGASEGALRGLAPHECIRIRRAGGGENYVHGGVSLQELCVPVLRFRNYRAGSRGFRERSRATLSLVSPLPMITNLAFELELLQNEPVGSKTLPAAYELQVIGPEGEAVTEAQRVLADSREPDAVDRTVHVGLHVREECARGGELRCRLVARVVGEKDANEVTLAEPVLCIAHVAPSPSDW